MAQLTFKLSPSEPKPEARLKFLEAKEAHYRQALDRNIPGAQIAPDAGDPHTNALLRLAVAINTKSETVQQMGNMVSVMAPGLKGNPFGWMGQAITIYADEDPFWDQLDASTNAEEFLESSYPRLPVALHLEVKNSLGAAAFLTALRAYIEQTAPNITRWQNLDHNGKAYVRITPAQRPADPDEKEWAVFYAVTPDSLTVTLNEPLLKRALDRHGARTTEKPAAAAGAKPWLGTNLCLQVEHKFFAVLQKALRDEYQSRLQLLAWNNLPILNEWKRLYPGQDPVKFHERLWGTKLLCPGGGTYGWNPQWRTMESTVFGHPGEPKTGPTAPLSTVTAANLGVSFENQGLSAKAVLDRNAAK